MSDYPINLVLRPLEGWPYEFTKYRKAAPFSATWGTTMAQLGAELRHLGARSGSNPAVLQLAIDEGQFRRDGMPRADARPRHPGVIISLDTTKTGAVSFPCDTFDRWQDNLRAITLALESLRRLDRYGITQTGQQYRGWQALEAKPSRPTVEAAIELLRTVASLWEPDVLIETLTKRAQRAAHPDRHNGDRTMWDKVEAAVTVLRRAGEL